MEEQSVAFRINDVDYPAATPDTYDLDELEILYDYSGLTVNLIDEKDALNPKVLKAIVHVSILRKSPDMDPDELRSLVGKVKLQALMDALSDEGDAVPLTSVPSEKPPAPKEAKRSSGVSGRPAGAPSPAPSRQGSIGTPASGTGQVYVPEILAR